MVVMTKPQLWRQAQDRYEKKKVRVSEGGVVQPRAGERTRPRQPLWLGALRKENSHNGKGKGNVLGWKEMKTQSPRVGPGLGGWRKSSPGFSWAKWPNAAVGWKCKKDKLEGSLTTEWWWHPTESTLCLKTEALRGKGPWGCSHNCHQKQTNKQKHPEGRAVEGAGVFAWPSWSPETDSLALTSPPQQQSPIIPAL